MSQAKNYSKLPVIFINCYLVSVFTTKMTLETGASLRLRMWAQLMCIQYRTFINKWIVNMGDPSPDYRDIKIGYPPQEGSLLLLIIT